MFCFFMSPHTQIRITVFDGVRIDIPNLEFSPNRTSIGFSQIIFPMIVLPKDNHTDFVQEEQLGDHDSGHLFRGRRIQISGHSDSVIFKNFGASSIFSWVQQPGNLEMISMIFAAVICDADDLFSVNTAQDPESSFTVSLRSTT